MNDRITLPTPPAIRGKLEKAGWRLTCEAGGGRGERWHHSDSVVVWVGEREAALTVTSSEAYIGLPVVAQFAAILGIPILGYRLVPEDVAQEMARRMLTLAEWFEKCYAGPSTGDEVQTDLRKWASALSGKGVATDET